MLPPAGIIIVAPVTIEISSGFGISLSSLIPSVTTKSVIDFISVEGEAFENVALNNTASPFLNSKFGISCSAPLSVALAPSSQLSRHHHGL